MAAYGADRRTEFYPPLPEAPKRRPKVSNQDMWRLIIVLFFTAPLNLHAQTDSTKALRLNGGWSLEAGAGYSRHFFLDLGVAYAENGSVGPHPQEFAAYIANEFYYTKNLIIAPKIGVWSGGGTGGIGLGLNFLY